MRDNIASLKLIELLTPKPRGEYVNGHVIQSVREPAPDYEAMRRLVSAPVTGTETPDEQSERN